jgi:hypothetical protein
MKRPWLYYISPATIAAAICFVLIITGLIETEDFDDAGNYFFVIVFVVIILILIAMGFAVRSATKDNVLYIWINEAVILAIPVVVFLIS